MTNRRHLITPDSARSCCALSPPRHSKSGSAAADGSRRALQPEDSTGNFCIAGRFSEPLRARAVTTDYPGADNNFSIRLELTRIR